MEVHHCSNKFHRNPPVEFNVSIILEIKVVVCQWNIVPAPGANGGFRTKKKAVAPRADFGIKKVD
jgi:hypothetical protein